MPGEARRKRLRVLLRLAGVPGDDVATVEGAFVHESAAKENALRSNERLEFLGDSVLGLIVSEWLCAQYTDDLEGTLAKRKAAIVSDSALAVSAKRLGFSDLLMLGTGERASGGAERASSLADAFEAFIASLYLHHGLAAAQRFVQREHIAHTDHTREAIGDAKTSLQEFTQEHFACTPDYREEGEGPSHLRTFTSFVTVKGELLGTGTGPSKKAAQQDAAAIALRTLQARKL